MKSAIKFLLDFLLLVYQNVLASTGTCTNNNTIHFKLIDFILVGFEKATVKRCDDGNHNCYIYFKASLIDHNKSISFFNGELLNEYQGVLPNNFEHVYPVQDRELTLQIQFFAISDPLDETGVDVDVTFTRMQQGTLNLDWNDRTIQLAWQNNHSFTSKVQTHTINNSLYPIKKTYGFIPPNMNYTVHVNISRQDCPTTTTRRTTTGTTPTKTTSTPQISSSGAKSTTTIETTSLTSIEASVSTSANTTGATTIDENSSGPSATKSFTSYASLDETSTSTVDSGTEELDVPESSTTWKTGETITTTIKIPVTKQPKATPRPVSTTADKIYSALAGVLMIFAMANLAQMYAIM